MSELSTATKHWKAKYDRANRVGVALSLVTLLLAFFNVMQALATTLRQEPEFIYRVDKQTVTLTIECSPELMLHYFEAKEEIAL
jgi:hypothetical protein